MVCFGDRFSDQKIILKEEYKKKKKKEKEKTDSKEPLLTMVETYNSFFSQEG